MLIILKQNFNQHLSLYLIAMLGLYGCPEDESLRETVEPTAGMTLLDRDMSLDPNGGALGGEEAGIMDMMVSPEPDHGPIGGDFIDSGPGGEPLGVDMALPLERFELRSCEPYWGGWISDARSVNPPALDLTKSLKDELLARISCITPDASLHALFTELRDIEVAQQLIAAAQAGSALHVLLVRPSDEVSALLDLHLGDAVQTCPSAGCAEGGGTQEANFVLMSKTMTQDGERDGAVVFLTSSLEESAQEGALGHIISRHGELEMYDRALEAWTALSQALEPSRAISQHHTDANSGAHILQLSLDVTNSEHSPRSVLSHLIHCDSGFGPDVKANIFIMAPRLSDNELWLMEHINRLEARVCSVKVLATEVGPQLASALGDRLRISSVPLAFSGMTAVAYNDLDGIRHEEAWIATPSWWTTDGAYEGGVFWQWNEALMLHHRDYLYELWQLSARP
jgi:hypothetical protein